MSVAKWEGRGHHNTNSVYPLPNDTTEHDRLDKQAEAINALMFGKPFHALERSLPGSQDDFEALDVGCGTGDLTCLLGNAVRNLASSKVYGLDLSPVPQERHPNPGNVEYIQKDISKIDGSDERLQPGSFNYVFSRLLISSITSWPNHLSVLHRLLRPGGYVELQETAWRYFDQSSGQEISHDWQWLQHLNKTLIEKNGTDFCAGEQLVEHLKAAGFVDVQVKVYVWPNNEEVWEAHPETRLAGIHTARELVDLKWTLAERILKVKGGFGDEKIQELKREYYATTRLKCFHKFYVAWGKKPE